MKKPLLNQEERECIRLKTFTGSYLELYLATKQLERSVYKEHGYIGLYLLRRIKIF